MERNTLIAARVLISIVFLLNGLNIVSQSLAAHEMAAHGVPVSLVPMMILGAQALQLVASIGLIFGIYPRLSALALLLFLIPATLMAHAFWQAAGTSMYTVQLVNFLKNVCMAGGLVFVAAAKTNLFCFHTQILKSLTDMHRALDQPGWANTLLVCILPFHHLRQLHSNKLQTR